MSRCCLVQWKNLTYCTAGYVNFILSLLPFSPSLPPVPQMIQLFTYTQTSVTYIPSSEAPMFYRHIYDYVCTAVMETSEAVGEQRRPMGLGSG